MKVDTQGEKYDLIYPEKRNVVLEMVFSLSPNDITFYFFPLKRGKCNVTWKPAPWRKVISGRFAVIKSSSRSLGRLSLAFRSQHHLKSDEVHEAFWASKH